MKAHIDFEIAPFQSMGIRTSGIRDTGRAMIYIKENQTETNQEICFLLECLKIWNQYKNRKPPEHYEEGLLWEQLQDLAGEIKKAGPFPFWYIGSYGAPQERYTVRNLETPIEGYRYIVSAEMHYRKTANGPERWYEVRPAAYFRTKEEAEAYKAEKIRDGQTEEEREAEREAAEEREEQAAQAVIDEYERTHPPEPEDLEIWAEFIKQAEQEE